jgi:DNA-binding NtrC family response regulator
MDAQARGRAVLTVWHYSCTCAVLAVCLAFGEVAVPTKVLVVDDESAITTTLSLILTNAGFQVSTANDGLSGLDAFRREKPDLLLTDVVMQEMTGIELAIQAKAMIPSCRVLLFSGQARTHDQLAEARSQGYNFDLLEKPVHPEQLLRHIHSLFSTSATATTAKDAVTQVAA